MPLSKAEDEAKRKADDRDRVFAIFKTTNAPVGIIDLELTRFKSSSASKPPPVLIKLTHVNVKETINIILKHASNLKGSTCSHVFLAPDPVAAREGVR